MWCCWGRLSVREAVTRSIVGWRWLIVHLAKCPGRRSKALRSAVGFRSVLCTGDLIALNLDGLLRFSQILIQLLERIILCIHLLIQLPDVLKQHLLLHFHLAESGLVLGQIIMHVLVCVIQVGDLTVLLQQQPSIVFDLLFQTPDVTLEFSERCFVTTLLDRSAIQRSVHCWRK